MEPRDASGVLGDVAGPGPESGEIRRFVLTPDGPLRSEAVPIYLW